MTSHSRGALLWFGRIALIMATSAGWTAHATSFSLSGDWSNSNNPNGPWSYNQGSAPLPPVSVWDGGGSALQGCSQPAWAPSNTPGNFLPAMMQANACSAGAFSTASGIPGNVKPGDIVTHTVDGFNGKPAAGVAKFLFTLPKGDDGTYEISGFVWDANTFFGTTRPQDWKLLVNGVSEASGVLSGTISRSQAATFDIVNALNAGETVELELYQDPNAAAGFFVGANMSILSTSGPTTPEPSTFGVLALGLLLCVVALRQSAPLQDSGSAGRKDAPSVEHAGERF